MVADAVVTTSGLHPLFQVTDLHNFESLDGTSRLVERSATPVSVYRYELRDRALWPVQFESPIFSLATRAAESIIVSYARTRFETSVSIDGTGSDLFCFMTQLRGNTLSVRDGHTVTSHAEAGFAWRPDPSTKVHFSDDNARTNVFLRVAEVEGALEHVLDDRLREPLEFNRHLDWRVGLGASLKQYLDFVTREFRLADGVTSSSVAMASISDLLVSLVLTGASHNYSERMVRTRYGAVPAYIHRAEDFMRAHCTQPIQMAQVAKAAGCSVSTLRASFLRFRGKTPLAVLHAIRLEHVYRELVGSDAGISIAMIARRYGFTNVTRFTAAFCRQFGKTPADVKRHVERS